MSLCVVDFVVAGGLCLLSLWFLRLLLWLVVYFGIGDVCCWIGVLLF